MAPWLLLASMHQVVFAGMANKFLCHLHHPTAATKCTNGWNNEPPTLITFMTQQISSGVTALLTSLKSLVPTLMALIKVKFAILSTIPVRKHLVPMPLPKLSHNILPLRNRFSSLQHDLHRREEDAKNDVLCSPCSVEPPRVSYGENQSTVKWIKLWQVIHSFLY